MNEKRKTETRRAASWSRRLSYVAVAAMFGVVAYALVAVVSK
jgi:hypothetical protein